MNEHKRVKHGSMPGEVSKRTKIMMREHSNRLIQVFPWYHITPSMSRSFRRYLSEKGRKVQRRRDRRAVLEGLDDA